MNEIIDFQFRAMKELEDYKKLEQINRNEKLSPD